MSKTALIIALAFASSNRADAALCRTVKGLITKSDSEIVTVKSDDGQKIQVILESLDMEQRQEIIAVSNLRKKKRQFNFCVPLRAISK